jgi:hypothetical protein
MTRSRLTELIAIRDEMQTSTNGVSRLVAAIKKFQPKLASSFRPGSNITLPSESEKKERRLVGISKHQMSWDLPTCWK